MNGLEQNSELTSLHPHPLGSHHRGALGRVARLSVARLSVWGRVLTIGGLAVARGRGSRRGVARLHGGAGVLGAGRGRCWLLGHCCHAGSLGLEI